jgi:hypothetical protein
MIIQRLIITFKPEGVEIRALMGSEEPEAGRGGPHLMSPARVTPRGRGVHS